MSGHPLASWPVVCSLALGLHLAFAVVPVRFSSGAEPQQFVDFELAELPPPPEVVPEPEPELPVKPPGPKNPDPTADPERTSVESNRPAEETATEPVPLRTGLALDPDQLVEGGMGVRVGNTLASGFDADVAPGELQGFVGGGAGGGDGQVVEPPPDRTPELLRSFQPRYPPQMRRQAIQGRVLMRVRVLQNGRAGEVTLLSGVHPDLDRVAMEAVKRFRWRPARRGGRPVPGSVDLAVRFTLDR